MIDHDTSCTLRNRLTPIMGRLQMMERQTEGKLSDCALASLVEAEAATYEMLATIEEEERKAGLRASQLEVWQDQFRQQWRTMCRGSMSRRVMFVILRATQVWTSKYSLITRTFVDCEPYVDQPRSFLVNWDGPETGDLLSFEGWLEAIKAQPQRVLTVRNAGRKTLQEILAAIEQAERESGLR